MQGWIEFKVSGRNCVEAFANYRPGLGGQQRALAELSVPRSVSINAPENSDTRDSTLTEKALRESLGRIAMNRANAGKH